MTARATRTGVLAAALVALVLLPMHAVAATPAGPAAAPKNPGLTGAQLEWQQKPKYPEGLEKIQKQGNVVLAGRLDTNGRLQDIVPTVATNLGFVDAAVDAVRLWRFKPAARGGKPIDIAMNVAVRFRVVSAKRGDIPRAILGDLSVFPANAAGGRAAPDGFPIRRGGDPRLRVEAVLDLPPNPKAQSLALRADAVSPTGRRVNLYSGTLPAPANAHEVPISFSAPVGGDWEDGIWSLALTLDDVPAGGGVFWLAGDPERFDFRAKAVQNAAAASRIPPAAVPGLAKPGAAKPGTKGVPAKPAPTRPPATPPKKA